MRAVVLALSAIAASAQTQTTSDNEYDYMWCTDTGCSVTFNLEVGGNVEVLATDFSGDNEYLEVYVNDVVQDEYCDPGKDADFDHWESCYIPAGTIKMQSTAAVGCCRYTKNDLGIEGAQVVVRVPVELNNGITDLSGLVAQFEEFKRLTNQKISWLEETNDAQAAEITDLKTTTDNQATTIANLETTTDNQATTIANQATTINNLQTTNDIQTATIANLEDVIATKLTRSSIIVETYGGYSTPGWNDTGRSVSNSFCALSRNQHLGYSSGSYLGCRVEQVSGTWQVYVWEPSGTWQNCRVMCLRW